MGAQKNRLKETVLGDGSFEYPQLMIWLRNKKIIFCYALLTKDLNHLFTRVSRMENYCLCNVKFIQKGTYFIHYSATLYEQSEKLL